VILKKLSPYFLIVISGLSFGKASSLSWPALVFQRSRKTKVIRKVMQMKCRRCGKLTSEFSDGYCLRCEKIATDVDAELAKGVE